MNGASLVVAGGSGAGRRMLDPAGRGRPGRVPAAPDRSGSQARLGAGRYRGQTLRKARVGPFVITETAYESGAVIDRHSHTNGYICLIRRGSYTEELPAARDGSIDRELVPLSTSYHPPGEEHGERIHAGGVLSFNIEIPPGWLARNTTKATGTRCVGEVGQPGTRSTWLASRLCHSFHHGPGLDESTIAEAVRELIDGGGPADPPSTAPPAWAERVRSRVSVDVTAPESLDELARRVGVHPVYLGAAFRRYFGLPIGDFRRNLQVAKASQDLALTARSLAQVGLDAGFFDQPHFTRTFKRYTGLTPRNFRRLYLALPAP